MFSIFPVSCLLFINVQPRKRGSTTANRANTGKVLWRLGCCNTWVTGSTELNGNWKIGSAFHLVFAEALLSGNEKKNTLLRKEVLVQAPCQQVVDNPLFLYVPWYNFIIFSTRHLMHFHYRSSSHYTHSMCLWRTKITMIWHKSINYIGDILVYRDCG